MLDNKQLIEEEDEDAEKDSEEEEEESLPEAKKEGADEHVQLKISLVDETRNKKTKQTLEFLFFQNCENFSDEENITRNKILKIFNKFLCEDNPEVITLFPLKTKIF